MVKRICSLLTLIVLLLTQCFTSMNYVFAESDDAEDFYIEENVNQTENEESFNGILEWEDNVESLSILGEEGQEVYDSSTQTSDEEEQKADDSLIEISEEEQKVVDPSTEIGSKT